MTFIGGFQGGAILYIIGAAFFFLGALVGLVSAVAGGARAIASSLLALLAAITLLVGSALFIGAFNTGGYTLVAGGALGDTGAASAGAILWVAARCARAARARSL